MDVMMPELDGNATMRAIRRMPQFADLPIIALTAKAMQGDREKSIRAGASDYFPKPVETDHLLRLMRRWLQHRAMRLVASQHIACNGYLMHLVDAVGDRHRRRGGPHCLQRRQV